jgi:acid phosphatase
MPQITPNMTNDGHDTNISYAASWERNWITPLLNNTYFMNNSLILLTFDEIETYPEPNKVFAVLLGGAIPDSLKGTTDDTFYNHYSTISSVSVNWGLPSLGRWDCEANVFALVANKTGYANAKVDTSNLFFNSSYPGPLSDTLYTSQWPVPNTGAKCAAGLGVLAAVKSTYANQTETFNYTNVYPYDAAASNNVGGTPVTGGVVSSPAGSTAGTGSASSTSAAPAASSSKSAASSVNVAGGAMSFVMAAAVALLM